MDSVQATSQRRALPRPDFPNLLAEARAIDQGQTSRRPDTSHLHAVLAFCDQLIEVNGELQALLYETAYRDGETQALARETATDRQ